MKKDMVQFIIKLFIGSNILLWSLPYSFSIGGVEINVVITVLCGIVASIRNRFFIQKRVIILYALVAYGGVVSLVNTSILLDTKILLSPLLAIIIIYSLNNLAIVIADDRFQFDKKFSYILIAIIILSCVIDYVYQIIKGAHFSVVRASGVFLEPSHLAMSSVPLLFVAWKNAVDAKGRFFLFTAGCMLFLLSPSATYLVLVGAVLLIELLFLGAKKCVKLVLLLLIAFIAGVVLLVESGYSNQIISRVLDVVRFGPWSNLSSLVYVNGWQLLIGYVSMTGGFGVGFNAMGSAIAPITEAAKFLADIGHADQNYNDGSFILSKIGSELGIIGVTLFIAAIVYTIKLPKRLKRLRCKYNLEYHSWIIPFVSAMTIGGLFRSTGYFSGPFILGLFFLIISVEQYKESE